MLCALRRPGHAVFTRWQVTLVLPPIWQGGGATSPYVFREWYEPEIGLLETFLKPGAVFVDGGANTGMYTFVAGRLVGANGRVIAFEPGSTCFEYLTRSRALNGFDQVELRKEALSDRCGTATLYHLDGKENSFTLGTPDDSRTVSETIRVTTLDATFAELQLERVDAIKLDIEGAEEFALRGGESLIERTTPAVLFEVFPAAARRLQLSADAAIEWLRKRNYRLYLIQPDGSPSLLTATPNARCNVLALHPSRHRQLP
jgi:FkbM family methyltransferase